MTDVAGVAVGTVEQAAVEDDAAADAGGHHHGDEVVLAGGRAAPPFPEGKGLGVVVDEREQARGLRQPPAQREIAPGRNVQRRDFLAARRHGPAGTNTAHRHLTVAANGVAQVEQHREQRLGVRTRRSRARGRRHKIAFGGHQPRRQLGAADVDGEGQLHEPRQ